MIHLHLVSKELPALAKQGDGEYEDPNQKTEMEWDAFWSWYDFIINSALLIATRFGRK